MDEADSDIAAEIIEETAAPALKMPSCWNLGFRRKAFFIGLRKKLHIQSESPVLMALQRIYFFELFGWNRKKHKIQTER